jgi:citrate lyase gamma subunit
MSNYINLIQEDMNPKMSDNIKSIVIEQYLQGKSRDDTSRDCGLGAGTVSNIIAAWKVNLTQYVVEDKGSLESILKNLELVQLNVLTDLRLYQC